MFSKLFKLASILQKRNYHKSAAKLIKIALNRHVILSNIVWDCDDDESVGLPTEVGFIIKDDNLAVYELTDLLSDHFGFLVETFEISHIFSTDRWDNLQYVIDV